MQCVRLRVHIFPSRRWYIAHTEKLITQAASDKAAAAAKVAAAKPKPKAKGKVKAEASEALHAVAAAAEAVSSELMEPPCKKLKLANSDAAPMLVAASSSSTGASSSSTTVGVLAPPPLASSSAASVCVSAAPPSHAALTPTATSATAEPTTSGLPFVIGPHLFGKKAGADNFHDFLLTRYPKLWEAAFKIPLVGKNNFTCWSPKLVEPLSWGAIAARVTCYFWGVDPQLLLASDKKFPTQLWQRYTEELLPTPTRNYKQILQKIYDYANKAPHGVPRVKFLRGDSVQAVELWSERSSD